MPDDSGRLWSGYIMETGEMNEMESVAAIRAMPAARPTLRGHIQIARFDHWVKNVFVLPGIIAAAGIDREHIPANLAVRIILGMLSIGLVASSNYVLNELLDAPNARLHPIHSA